MRVSREHFPCVLHATGRRTFSAKGQRVNIFGFSGFVTRTQLYHFRANAATDDM